MARVKSLDSFPPEFPLIWDQLRRIGWYQVDCPDKGYAQSVKFQFYVYQKSLEAAGLESPKVSVSVKGTLVTLRFAVVSNIVLAKGLANAAPLPTQPVQAVQAIGGEPEESGQEDQGPPGWLEIPGKGWFDPEDPSDRLSLIQAGILLE